VFRASNGRLEGRDWDGVRYTGTAIETADGKIRVDLSQHVPPGVGLVGGKSIEIARVPIHGNRRWMLAGTNLRNWRKMTKQESGGINAWPR
jgi:hypothetical protein